MKKFLYVVAAITFFAPILVWLYIIALAKAFSNSSSSGFNPLDFLSMEFLTLAVVPWLISFACFYAARKKK
ncbi:hypothetical protein RB2150_03858 [Rhodobacterales bacterium HTCC2150]|nr:hypothetical protein RB2150_03858 [Rhodobacterales bacterium HTCC2150] [Rhodobacteraceae bacterium HTCC2150]